MNGKVGSLKRREGHFPLGWLPPGIHRSTQDNARQICDLRAGFLDSDQILQVRGGGHMLLRLIGRCVTRIDQTIRIPLPGSKPW